MKYETEEEFLKNYKKEDYERLSMTVDIAVFSVANADVDNYRKLSEKQFSILLIKRENHPFKNKWCLPGGFININENLDAAAIRILSKETGVEDIYLEQLYTFSDPKRDPRMRVISSSYLALIDKNRLENKLPANASWFQLHIIEDENEFLITFNNGNEEFFIKVGKKLKDKTTDRYQYIAQKNDDLAFDHPIVIASGISRLKNKIKYTDIVFNMMPEYFTLKELQQVYEIILGKKLLDPAFRRIIASKVEKTNKIKTGGGHRPSALFTYQKNERELKSQ